MPNPNQNNPGTTNRPGTPGTPGNPDRDQGEREGQRNRDQGGSQRKTESGNVDEREQNQRPGDEEEMERDNRGAPRKPSSGDTGK